MKFIFTLLLALPIFVFAQQTTVTVEYDGVTRQYIKYVPAIYDANEATPVVFAFHGLGDTMQNFFGTGFKNIADTANFIYIVPQALVDAITGGTAWNSGAGVFGIFPNPDVDDAGLVQNILDTINAQYNIDETQIFAAGFSMGGFFTNRLACEMTDVFAATASVAGTIGSGVTCNPSSKLRVCHFHGTSDGTVGYGLDNGGLQDNLFGSSAQEWYNFWQGHNECVGNDIGGSFPNTNLGDGFTVDYFEHSGCSESSEVVHYKIHGADHIWLGPNNDIFYTMEIWKFFNDWGPTTLSPIEPDGVEENLSDGSVVIYPDPTTDILNIAGLEGRLNQIKLINSVGQIEAVYNSTQMNVGSFNAGVYLLQIELEDRTLIKRFVKQ
ncbi:MAG: polyhydroxybutyrate depolymerase [Flavobacteriales bacterium]|jgi:polyhydroxybutyrate depolymerase